MCYHVVEKHTGGQDMEQLQLRKTQPVWERIAQTKKPVVLYGMGNGGDRILDIMEQRGIPCTGVFASDGFVRGQSFRGFPVLTLKEAESRWGDFLIVQCFAVHDAPTLGNIRQLAARHELLFPDIPVAGEQLFTPEYFRKHRALFAEAYSLMGDALSRKVFQSVLDFKISGEPRCLFECESPREEALSLLHPGPREHYVDCGAYNGDTVEEFLQLCGGQFGSITALEPNPKNFLKLSRRIQRPGLENILLYNCGVWDADGELCFTGKDGRGCAVSKAASGKDSGRPIPVRSLDSLLSGRPVTLLKLDVEGCERRALSGARNLIRRQAPCILAAAYHRNEDLFDLPLYLRSLCPDYRFYLRHQPYLPAWETVLLAIPERRYSP